MRTPGVRSRRAYPIVQPTGATDAAGGGGVVVGAAGVGAGAGVPVDGRTVAAGALVAGLEAGGAWQAHSNTKPTAANARRIMPASSCAACRPTCHTAHTHTPRPPPHSAPEPHGCSNGCTDNCSAHRTADAGSHGQSCCGHPVHSTRNDVAIRARAPHRVGVLTNTQLAFALAYPVVVHVRGLVAHRVRCCGISCRRTWARVAARIRSLTGRLLSAAMLSSASATSGSSRYAMRLRAGG